ncbi:hypothetical protein [Bacillus bombysepticus]|uniref:hypothetical protein n=1 Tax=Bacillus bombysepticus TaxID=658666 RepID=UPI003015ED07
MGMQLENLPKDRIIKVNGKVGKPYPIYKDNSYANVMIGYGLDLGPKKIDKPIEVFEIPTNEEKVEYLKKSVWHAKITKAYCFKDYHYVILECVGKEDGEISYSAYIDFEMINLRFDTIEEAILGVLENRFKGGTTPPGIAPVLVNSAAHCGVLLEMENFRYNALENKFNAQEKKAKLDKLLQQELSGFKVSNIIVIGEYEYVVVEVITEDDSKVYYPYYNFNTDIFTPDKTIEGALVSLLANKYQPYTNVAAKFCKRLLQLDK